ncbi:TPA: hypothetical protein NKZ56_001506 [Vibrio parahaemolyticus]|nr:hypothetical protein [Vibrio parahaemolyticus]
MNCFFISKPIQYHNVRQLQKQIKGKKHLVIFGHFIKAYEFYNSVKEYDDVWDEVFYFTSRLKAYYFIYNSYSSSNIFLDSDYGKDSLLVSLISKNHNKISLYEEGSFSYEDDLQSYYKNKFPVRTKIYSMVSLPKALGVSKYIKYYYVYDLERFFIKRKDISHKARIISHGFIPDSCDLSTYKKVFNFNFDLKDRNVFIYAGSKYIKEIVSVDELIEMSKGSSVILFKPHPGSTYDISQVIEKFSLLNVLIFDNIIPIELALTLLGECSSITIGHHNSSIDGYVKSTHYKVVNLSLC